MVQLTARPLSGSLREWRRRRGLSQLELALQADISQRHLSFIENARSIPSRGMLLHLARRLEIPLRERNQMLLAAGYAPMYPERPLGDPALTAARRAVELILKGHEPFPALAVDRYWSLVAANDAFAPLLAGVAKPSLLSPPINVLRLSLHPEGLAPHIVNLSEWRAHLIQRLHREIAMTADEGLTRLLQEFDSYSPMASSSVSSDALERDFAGIVVPLELRTPEGVLSLFSTTTVFGTPVDITLSELALEAFFPANSETAAMLEHLAQTRRVAQ
jgi:transcriptional regulator with XRE-family HTH domain